jgi:dimeric dUTPase (all-alpha-NTP-PPase superfamily)
MNKNLQKKTIKEAQRLKNKVEKATEKNVLIRQQLEDKMLAVQKKLTPLLNQRDAINRAYTQLDKPLAETIVFSEYVSLISRTPQAYGFKDAEEVISKLL